MKSVGEVMAIGRTFQESFQKALRSLETGCHGFTCDQTSDFSSLSEVRSKLEISSPDRIFLIYKALKLGMTIEEIHELTAIDMWFLDKLRDIFNTEKYLKQFILKDISKVQMRLVKQKGFSDYQIAQITETTENEVREYRKSLGVIPVYKVVDTCAAEFEAFTPYYYSTYELEDTEVLSTQKPKIMILGGGPNRIGQGIEFDYCCCHASFALTEAGYETIMVNSNPETVSTDYDTSDRLYFEPLTKEDILNIIEVENPEGVIIQFGGQTPLKLAVPLQEYFDSPNCSVQTKIWGTSPDSIDLAEDRERFEKILYDLEIKKPPSGIARSFEQSLNIASHIGYPVVVRPSYVLGGRAMQIVFSDKELQHYMNYAIQVEPDHPILIDKFLEDAIEVDVDALCDKTGMVVIGGIMEHIEQAGIHSGDSACSIPFITLSQKVLNIIRGWTSQLANSLKVIGLINIQYAVQGEEVYILEANPRASRTVPYVSKTTGRPLAKIASLLISGKTLCELGVHTELIPRYVSVKEAVLPFQKFPGTDTLLGPEMRSTGEVMGIDNDFGKAFAKAAIASGVNLPISGTVFISTSDIDKILTVPIAKNLEELGFKIVATLGTQKVLENNGIKGVEIVPKLHEGRPHVIDWIKNKKIQLIINTPNGEESQVDAQKIRRTALDYQLPVVTTIAGAKATVTAIRSLQSQPLKVKALQDYIC
ncbi:MAG: carbamoylphosphate synthase large subunit [Candidatus Atelocyanobacterium thalassa isolate SIO64986]|uniref:Carbamoylphosphate synthase large subunit n=1 Tax=Candidatus Atelocyanobacterium thalassa isolate SIO64986 TaxID=1527444 RepID=A0A086CIW3_9CHRO|nr:MAG: carbamoylphosphate synthase large subunit [Candidatus Atelocyanobacterium thalassa isolate SIO64986]